MLSIYAACCITAMPSTGNSAVTNELVVVANLILLSRQSAKKEGSKVSYTLPSSWRQKGSGATSMGKTGRWHAHTWKRREWTRKFGQIESLVRVCCLCWYYNIRQSGSQAKWYAPLIWWSTCLSLYSISCTVQVLCYVLPLCLHKWSGLVRRFIQQSWHDLMRYALIVLPIHGN